MEWPVILAILLAGAIILFPAVFIWYLNIGGMYATIRERGRFRISETARRTTRIVLAIFLPVAIYAVLIWFFYGHFGWQVAVAVAVVFPIVLFIPAVIWMAVVSGLYQVVRDRMRRRVTVRRRIAAKMVEEPVTRRVT